MQSEDIILAFRSIVFKLNLSWSWVEDIFIFLDMTIRFFPTFKEEWQQMQRSQKALSISSPKTFTGKSLQVANFIPDFVILNLNKSETITQVMRMRGYGSVFPRTLYPIIPITKII
jgi:energy-coupling factor transporter transmembrane protein EcfT